MPQRPDEENKIKIGLFAQQHYYQIIIRILLLPLWLCVFAVRILF
jgi:hypothetical protein